MNFLILSIVKAAVVAFVLLTALAYLQWLERKVLAHIQLRVGPRRVGPHGLLQPLADVIKLITKEDMMPSHVNKVFWFMAPFIAVLFALIPIAVIPFGTELALPAINLGPIHIPAITTAMQLTDLNIGVLFILGISGLGVYGVALAGWSSNNKYSLLGSLRSSAQLISYELALGLSLVGVVLRAGSLNLRVIVEQQATKGIATWNLFGGLQFIAFFIYLMAAYAETNRSPFDLPEAESELTGGYHTEYSSMKFAMFFMAEYANMITVACVATLLFFGGPSSPLGHLLPDNFGGTFLAAIFPILWFVAKVLAFLLLYIWVRATLPRFRYDQLMAFGWKFLLPVAILNIIVTSLVLALKG